MTSHQDEGVRRLAIGCGVALAFGTALYLLSEGPGLSIIEWLILGLVSLGVFGIGWGAVTLIWWIKKGFRGY